MRLSTFTIGSMLVLAGFIGIPTSKAGDPIIVLSKQYQHKYLGGSFGGEVADVIARVVKECQIRPGELVVITETDGFKTEKHVPITIEDNKALKLAESFLLAFAGTYATKESFPRMMSSKLVSGMPKQLPRNEQGDADSIRWAVERFPSNVPIDEVQLGQSDPVGDRDRVQTIVFRSEEANALIRLINLVCD